MTTDEDATHTPPETPRRPVTDTLHGEEITDPYRWLEDDSEEVTEWTASQNDYAKSVLDTPERATLTDRYDEIARVTEYGAITPAGDRYFQEVGHPETEQPILYAFDSLADLRESDGRALVDPNEFDDSGTTSVDWYVPGPDGDVLAYGVAEGGDEQYDVHLIDVSDGSERAVLAGVGRTSAESFGWVTESDDERPSGFYYVATGNAGDGSQLEKELRYHALEDTSEANTSEPDASDDLVVADWFSEQQWPSIHTDGETLIVETMENWTRTDVHSYRGPPAEASLTPVLTDYDAAFSVELSSDRLYLLTDHEAPFSKVIATSLSDALAETERPVSEFATVVPEGEAVLRNIDVEDGRLYVHAHRDARSELSVYDETTDETTGIELPSFCSVDSLTTGPSGAAFLRVQSFATPQEVCRVDPETDEMETLTAQDTDVPFEIDVSQIWVTSADGTEVPAFVVRRDDVEPDGENPALMTGYGGFKVNQTPSFDRFRLPFLRAGGVFVLATLRGGTEYGKPWHEDGRLANKQNVFDDAIAVGESLIDRGWADEDRLAVSGGSNGGLLVGALLTQRPALWRATLCHVPLLDMLRFHTFLLGASWTSEYGSPDDPDAFEYIREYSPYHNVTETAYPATMVTTALGDTRVHPSHARKMTARLQANDTGPFPTILRVDDDSGHSIGKPTSMLVDEQAERWGFLADQLDVNVSGLD